MDTHSPYPTTQRHTQSTLLVPPPPSPVFSKFNLAIAESQGWGGQRNCTAALGHYRDVAYASEWLVTLPYADDAAYANYVSGDFDVAFRQVRACGRVNVNVPAATLSCPSDAGAHTLPRGPDLS